MSAQKNGFVLDSSDLMKTIGALQHMIDSKKAINAEGLKGRIKKLKSKLNAIRKREIPEPASSTGIPTSHSA